MPAPFSSPASVFASTEASVPAAPVAGGAASRRLTAGRVALCVAAMLALQGCAGMSARETSTVVGATAGAVVGGVLTGTTTGAAVGAAAGGMLGNELSKKRGH